MRHFSKLCAVAALTCGAAHGLDLKGVPLGTDRHAIAQKFSQQACRPSTGRYQACAVLGETFAGVVPVLFDVSYVDDKLAGYFIRLSGRHIDALYASVVERAGKPTTAVVLAASKNMPREALYPYEPQSYLWTLADGRMLTLSFNGSEQPTFASDIWETTLSVSSRESMQEFAARRGAAANAAAAKAKADM